MSAFGMPLGGLPPELLAKQQNEQSQINGLMSKYSGLCACILCTPAASGGSANDALQRIKQESYRDIMAHEQAHASAAGAFGGGIVINYDANGVAVAGHVPLSIPRLDRLNPENSIKAYQTIKGAANAPHDPSAQDKAISSRMDGLIGRAQVLMNEKQRKMRMGLPPTAPMPGGLSMGF